MWNWFDVALVILLVWSAALGLRAGLARVVIGLAATLTGLLLGFWLYRLPASEFVQWVGQPQFADFLGFLAIFIGVVLLGWLLAALLSRLFDWVGLSWFNHLMGGVAGFIRGAVLIAALLDVAIAFAPSPLPDVMQRSRVLPYATELSWWLVDLAPRELRDAFSERMENLKRFWARPQNQNSQIA